MKPFSIFIYSHSHDFASKMLNLAIVSSLMLIFVATKSCHAGVPRFTIHPRNKTVNFGDFIDFECQVAVDDVQAYRLNLHAGEFYIPIGGSASGVRTGNPFLNLSEREFSATVNGTLGKYWILINNKTLSLQLLQNFYCSVVYGLPLTHRESEFAYIDIKYPECTSHSQSECNSIQPTSTLTHHVTSTSFVPDCQLPTCTCVSLSSSNLPDEPKVDNHQALFYYQIAFGVFLSLFLLIILVLGVIFVRMCIIRRNKFREESSQNTANRICDALIRNPIYDGPVYESVQPRFETLTTAAQKPSTTSAASASDSFEQTNLLLDISNDSTRYVSKPSLSPVMQCGQPSPYIYPQDPINIEDCCRERPASTVTDEHSLATKMIVSDGINPNISKDFTCNVKEDAYTVMNPAGTLAASLSGGWDGEVTQIETM